MTVTGNLAFLKVAKKLQLQTSRLRDKAARVTPNHIAFKLESVFKRGSISLKTWYNSVESLETTRKYTGRYPRYCERFVLAWMRAILGDETRGIYIFNGDSGNM